MKLPEFISAWTCIWRAFAPRGLRFLVVLWVLLAVSLPAAAQDKDGPPTSATATVQQDGKEPKQPGKASAADKAPTVKVIRNNGDPPTSTELDARMRSAERADQNIGRTLRQLNSTTRQMRQNLGRIQTLNRLNMNRPFR